VAESLRGGTGPIGQERICVSAILELVGVSRVYRQGTIEVVALQDVSLSVEPGELVAVMGPSGSGKSTLLNVAGGLDRPSSGEVFVDGTELSSLSVGGLAVIRRSSVGYVFQELNLVGNLTAAENVALPLELGGVSARKSKVLALETLALVGMADGLPASPISCQEANSSGWLSPGPWSGHDG